MVSIVTLQLHHFTYPCHHLFACPPTNTTTNTISTTSYQLPPSTTPFTRKRSKIYPQGVSPAVKIPPGDQTDMVSERNRKTRQTKSTYQLMCDGSAGVLVLLCYYHAHITTRCIATISCCDALRCRALPPRERIDRRCWC